MGLAALVAISIYPVPLPGLTEHAARELATLLQRPVSVGSAKLGLVDRTLELGDIRAEPDSASPEAAAGPPLVIDHAMAHLRWINWRPWHWEAELTAIELNGVQGAELVMDADGMTLLRHGPRVVEWAGRGKLGELNLDTLELPGVTLLNADVTLLQIGPESVKEAFTGRDMSLDMNISSKGILRAITWRGRWQPLTGEERPFHGALRRTGPQALSLITRLEGFDSDDTLPLPGALRLVGQSLELHSRLSFAPDQQFIDTTITGEAIHWALAGRGLMLGLPALGTEAEPEIRFRLRPDPKGERWELEESTLALSGARLEASGHVLRQPGWPLDLNIVGDDVSVLRDMLNHFLQRFDTELTQADIGIAMHLVGEAVDPKEITIDGAIEVASAEVLVGRAHPQRGEDFSATIAVRREARRETFELRGLSGRIGDVNVAVPRATVERVPEPGSPWRTELAMEFEVSGEVAEAAKSFPIARSRITLTDGDFSAEGSLRQVFSVGVTGLLASPPEVRGSAVIRNVAFDLNESGTHVQMPEGTVLLEGRTLWWDETEAMVGGQTVTVSGRASVERGMWMSPRFALEASAPLDLETMFHETPALESSLPLASPPTGTVDMVVTLDGALQDMDGWNRRVRLHPRGVTLALPSSPEPVLVSLATGEIAVTPERISLSDIGIDLRGVPLRLSGGLTLARGDVVLESETEGSLLADAFPSALNQVAMAGSIEMHVELGLDWSTLPLPATPENLTQMTTLAALGAGLSQRLREWDVNRERPPLEIRAVFDVEDYTFTPIIFPDEVTHAYARITWDGEVFRTENARAQVGVNPDCLVRFGEFRPINPQSIAFDVHAPVADLTAWAQPWTRSDRRDMTPRERRTLAYSEGYPGRVTATEGRITTDEVRWKNLVGGRGTAVIAHEFNRPERLTRLRIEPITIQGFGGRGSGHLHITGTELGNSIEIYSAAENLEIEPIITGLREGNPTQVEGRLTGNVLLNIAPNQSWQEMTGAGAIEVTESSMFQSTLFHQLGRMTGVQEFDNVSFSSITADLEIGGGGVTSRNVEMDTTWVNIEGEGRVGFDRSIDFDMHMSMLRRAFGGVPVIGWLGQMVDSAINSVLLSVRVGGTLDEPQVRLVQPLVDAVIPGGG
jgi:hypothetical protein